MGKGAGHVVYRLSKELGISVKEAGTMLASGKGWDQVTALFKGGK
jgi:D-ornithine 4,5-aminomutase subunit alpha